MTICRPHEWPGSLQGRSWGNNRRRRICQWMFPSTAARYSKGDEWAIDTTICIYSLGVGHRGHWRSWGWWGYLRWLATTQNHLEWYSNSSAHGISDRKRITSTHKQRGVAESYEGRDGRLFTRLTSLSEFRLCLSRKTEFSWQCMLWWKIREPCWSSNCDTASDKWNGERDIIYLYKSEMDTINQEFMRAFCSYLRALPAVDGMWHDPVEDDERLSTIFHRTILWRWLHRIGQDKTSKAFGI